MALSAFPPTPIWRQFPIERPISRLLDCMLQEFDEEIKPQWLSAADGKDFGKVVNDKDKFCIELDVSHFRPEELSAKVHDCELSVEGHHEERSDQRGSVEQHFIRKYNIPKDVLQDSLESQLSDQGVLRIIAKKKAIEGSQSKNIPIQSAQHVDGDEKQ